MELEQVLLIRVNEHKTGRVGAATLMLSDVDYSRLRHYFTCIQPLQDTEGVSPYMLVYWGGIKI